eukprot:10860295-Alexandrium_andersonii.AAC.1
MTHLAREARSLTSGACVLSRVPRPQAPDRRTLAHLLSEQAPAHSMRARTQRERSARSAARPCALALCTQARRINLHLRARPRACAWARKTCLLYTSDAADDM